MGLPDTREHKDPSNGVFAVAGGELAMAARPASARKALLRLSAVALRFFVVLGLALALAGMMVQRTLPSSTFAPFGGWQLNAAAISLAVVLLAMLAVCTVALIRRYRALRGRSPLRRAIVLAAFLPGAFIGGLAGDPMSAAISWISHHTAAASRARVAARELLAEDGKAPPAVPAGSAAPPPAVAGRMLHASDLGTGWYDGLRPNPAESTISPLAARLGASEAVRADFNQAHWTGAAWLPQHLVLESLLRFRSPGQAQRYLGVFSAKQATTVIAVGDATVYEAGLGSTAAWRSGTFILGADVFNVSINVLASGAPTDTDFATLVERTVQRATTGR